VLVNGKMAFSGYVSENKKFLIGQFLEKHDRKALWVNSINIDSSQFTGY